MYGALILTIVRIGQRRQRSAFACLSCRKPLTLVPAQIAVATGICSYCGGSIFGEEASRAASAS